MKYTFSFLLIMIFSCSPSKPEESEYICADEIDCNDPSYEYATGYYFNCEDLTTLQEFINLNSNTYKHYLDDNGNGCIEPLSEFGIQIWDSSLVSPYGSGKLLSLDLSYNEEMITDPNNPSQLDDTNHRLLNFPENIANLDSLKILKLNDNDFTSLPEDINNLINLRKLEIASNLLTNLPQDFGDFPKLEELIINYNDIRYLPESMGNLIALEKLMAQHNSLFYLPSSLGNLAQLEWLYLNDNDLDSIPRTFGNLISLKHFVLDNNSLESLPEEICNLDENGDSTLISSELINFSLVNNYICPGDYPNCVTYSDIGFQTCSGCPPSHFMVEGICVLASDYQILQDFIDLNPESLIGGFRASDCYNEDWWDSFEDEETGEESSRLVEIAFNGKNLHSEIPDFLSNLEKLKILRLESNGLTGTIPNSLTELSNLKTLKLNSNQLNGNLPENIGILTNLDTLWIAYNQLEGELPESLTQLSTLIHLRLDHNDIEGEIPSNIGNLTSLKYLRLDNNNLSGEIPLSISNLLNLKRLYLLFNNLSGQVPESLCELETLVNPIVNFLLHNNEFCPGESGYPSCMPEDQINQQNTENCPDP